MANRPYPSDPAESKRWKETSRRHRMITGAWEKDAAEHFACFFDPSVKGHLPAPETSRCQLLTLNQQLNVAYNEDPRVSVEEEDADLGPLRLSDLWAIQLQNGLNILALNESLVRVEWKGGRVSYRIVTPDKVTGLKQDPNDPSRLTAIEEQRERTDDEGETVWTWDVFDLTDPTNPSYRVEVEDDGKRLDVTETWAPEAVGAYPYIDESGPIMPYVLYHRRFGSHLWDYLTGSELVRGSLTECALWTFWLGGTRDASYPLRVLFNGIVQGATTKDGVSAEVTIDPTVILQINDTSGNARIDQLPATISPSDLAGAIETWAAGLAVHAGLTASDVSRTSQISSGYGVTVQREGQRRMMRALVPSLRRSDRITIETAARMNNAYGGTALPAESEDYSIEYAGVGYSSEELMARTAVDDAEVQAGYRHPVEAWIARHPGQSYEEAEAAMLEAAAFKRTLAEGGSVDTTAAEEVDVDAPEDDTASDAPPDGEAGAPEGEAAVPALALNGAQVSAAQGIVESVAVGALPRETGVKMLVTFFNIAEDVAQDLMGAVGKGFKPAAPPG